jgi:hypothetical protein
LEITGGLASQLDMAGVQAPANVSPLGKADD